MDAERSWSEDAVAVGRRAEPAAQEKPAPRSRGPKQRRPPLPLLRLVGAAAAIVLVVVVVASLGGGGEGGGQQPALKVDVVPARPAAVPKLAAPQPMRGRAKAPDPALKRQPKGQLERRNPEPKASGPDHELAAPLAPEPEAPPPVEEPASQATAPSSAPSPPAPPPGATPPAVEFGL
jgi:hypothetical protein